MDDTPQELIDYIVSFINDDRKTLRHIRLVNHRLNQSSTKHLFLTLDLTIGLATGYDRAAPSLQQYTRFQALLSLIQSNPAIPNAVHNVELDDLGRLSDDERQLVHPTLCAILDYLPRVSSLFLRGICFPRVHTSLLQSLIKKLTSQNLEKLDIWNCQFSKTDDLLHFLNDRCTIRSLRIGLFKEAALPAGQEPTPLFATHGEEIRENPGARLDSLTIEKDSPSIIVNALSPTTTTPRAFDLTHIRHLVLTGIQDLPAANSLLRIIGGSLQSLYLSSAALQLSPQDKKPSTLDLQFNVNLENLRISSLQWTATQCPADRICNIFKNDVTLSKLKDIQLVLTAWIKRPHTSLLYDKWMDLDDLFSNGSSFPSLKSVKVIVHADNLPPNLKPNPSELIPYFPKLSRADIISCTLWQDDKRQCL
ncbi:hypothetical protein CVT24_008702 [Panaeolus cyanescens]|uniref:F-box domain-containing protein n=1 Tax=Panaeolus cyanescens TaxID=181874 RepID=A0A409VKM1_9AGAR|nr:hypothetical protein CVT24_008702 [Panaeolus cyanescens]